MSHQLFENQKGSNKVEIELGTDFNPKFNSEGLIPCITVDDSTNEVLMFAWMSKEALELTLKTNKATYFSRSRQSLWVKGEESGLEQIVKQVLVDCDQDVIQLRVKVTGEGTCHNGYRSCFYRAVKNKSMNELEYVIDERSFDPDDVYDQGSQ